MGGWRGYPTPYSGLGRGVTARCQPTKFARALEKGEPEFRLPYKVGPPTERRRLIGALIYKAYILSCLLYGAPDMLTSSCNGLNGFGTDQAGCHQRLSQCSKKCPYRANLQGLNSSFDIEERVQGW